MSGYHRVLSLALAAADDDGISTSQAGTAATPLTITGALASGGVATLDVARRVAITSAADDSAVTFTIVGTDRNGRAQTKTLVGANTDIVYTTEDFKTVTSVTPSGNTAGNVKVGTVAVGSTVPHIIDRYTNPQNTSYAIDYTGTVTATLEISYDNLAPEWDLPGNTAIWRDYFAADGIINGPFTMARLKILSGTGTARLTLVTGMGMGRI